MAGRGRTRSGKGTATDRKLMAIEVNGEHITVDSKAMSIAERQLVRSELAKLAAPDFMDSVAGAVWITLRRNDKALTFAEVCENLTVEQLEGAEYVDAEDASPEA